MPSEDSFPTLLKSFIIITLFAFSLLSITILFAENYGRDTTEIDERIGLDSINSTLQTAQGEGAGWQTRFQEIGESEGFFEGLLDVIGFLSVGMLSLFKGMINFIFLPFEIFTNIIVNVLGVPIIVMNIINVLIILTIIFGIWSLIKRGI